MTSKIALKAALAGEVLLLAALLAPVPSQARVGVGVGVPAHRRWPYRPYRRYPFYRLPPPVVYAPVPPVMVATPPPPPPSGQPPAHRWYYCDDPPGYYPHVRSCNTDWRPVPATPQSQ